jgi:hypothetical protein
MQKHAPKAEMLLPTLRCIGEVGIDVSAMENIAGATRIENTMRRHSNTPPILQPQLLR